MSGMPEIGLRLHGGLDPHRCVALARAAEAGNFASVWFAENPFEHGVLPAAAAAAAATERIRIGIGVWNPYNRHPSLIAMEIGALDALARGRAALGIGSGIASAIEKLGLDNTRPLSALRDTVHIVRALLRGEEVTYTGAVFSANRVKLGCAPLRCDMPIFMAARGDKALQLCGEVADGLMVSNFCSPTYTARAVDVVGKAAAASGRPVPPRVIQYVPCCPRPDGGEARQAVKPTLAAMLKQFWALAQRVPSAREAMRHDAIPETDFRTAAERISAGEAAGRALDDRFVDVFAIAGTAEECRERIADYGRAGVSELGLNFVGEQPFADIEYLARALTAG